MFPFTFPTLRCFLGSASDAPQVFLPGRYCSCCYALPPCVRSYTGLYQLTKPYPYPHPISQSLSHKCLDSLFFQYFGFPHSPEPGRPPPYTTTPPTRGANAGHRAHSAALLSQKKIYPQKPTHIYMLGAALLVLPRPTLPVLNPFLALLGHSHKHQRYAACRSMQQQHPPPPSIFLCNRELICGFHEGVGWSSH